MGDIMLSSATPEIPLPLHGDMRTRHRNAAQSLTEGASAFQMPTFNGSLLLPTPGYLLVGEKQT